jgi:hypothetical protein
VLGGVELREWIRDEMMEEKGLELGEGEIGM